MSTHNIGFYEDSTKNIFQLRVSSNTYLGSDFIFLIIYSYFSVKTCRGYSLESQWQEDSNRATT